MEKSKSKTSKGVKRDRTVYLAGPKKGRARPSSGTRERRRRDAGYDRRRNDERALEELVQQLEDEEVEDAKTELKTDASASGRVVKFRLGRGYREEREGVTEYSLYDEEESEWLKKLVFVSAADMKSGRRWFSEGYPEEWTEVCTKRELAKRAERSGRDYGKEFVEYRGRWYEAVEETGIQEPK